MVGLIFLGFFTKTVQEGLFADLLPYIKYIKKTKSGIPWFLGLDPPLLQK